MVFSSTLFLFLFLPVFLALYFCVNKLKWKNAVLLAGSLIFYAWGEPVYIVLMLGSILANYLFAIRIDEAKLADKNPEDSKDSEDPKALGDSENPENPEAPEDSGKKSKKWLIGAAASFNLALRGIYKYAGLVAAKVNKLIVLPAKKWLIGLPILEKSKKWLIGAVSSFNLALRGIYKYAGLLAAKVNKLIVLPTKKWLIGLSALEKSKKWLIGAVSFNLILLGIFKYAGFVAANVNMLIGLPAPEWHVPLPIGISFYTFQILSYVIDVYRGNVAVQRNAFYLGAYIAGFPQLIAGPIVRYETIEYELHHRSVNAADFASGIRRFIVGLSKKVLIANNVAFVADTILARTPAEYGMIGAWTALICYTFQIYFDFSGYSDMAIGLGRMLGFHYLENFNYPYIAKSVTEFWRRWHMSLSSFFRDYVYIPLGGNRVNRRRFILNILIVWSLTGLWHGSSWNFVLWGAYYGALLLIEKLLIGDDLQKLPAPVKHIYTMLAVMIGWAIFRMENLSGVMQLLKALAGGYGTSSIGFLNTISVLQGKYILAVVIAIVAATPVIPTLAARLGKERVERTDFVILTDAALMLLLLLAVISLVSGSFNPFIYFRF